MKDLNHNDIAEKTLLGSMLLDKSAIFDASQAGINEDSFASNENYCVYQAIQAVHARGKHVDISTVMSELKSGGSHISEITLHDMIDRVTTVHHAPEVAATVKEKQRRRDLAKIADTLKTIAHDDAYEISEIVTEVSGLINNAMSSKEVSLTNEEAIIHKIEQWKNAAKGIKDIGLPPHFRQLESIFPLFRFGKLYTIGARSGGGKSTIGRNLASYWACDLNVPVAYVSIEMDIDEVLGAIVAQRAGVSQYCLDNGFPDEGFSRLRQAQKYSDDFISNKYPLIVNDTITNADELDLWCSVMVPKYGIKALVLDYIQILEDGKLAARREGHSRFSATVNQLRRLAKKHHIIFIALSQLLEGKDEDEPKASDVFGGRILQHASYGMIFLYVTQGQMWCDVKKHRVGVLNRIRVKLENGAITSGEINE